MRMKSKFRSSCALLIVGGATGLCAPLTAAAAADAVVAKGGSVELGSEDVRALVASLPEGTRSAAVANLGALEQLLRAEVVQRSVLTDARAQNFEHDAGAVRQLQRLHDEALTRLWLASKANVPAGYPGEADVQTAYDSLRRDLPTEYHLAQIYIAAPDGGEPARLAAALRKAGEVGTRVATTDFAQLAREQSEQAETASRGGDLGFLPAGKLLPEVFSAVRSLKPGETTGPVKTAQGLHFLKLIERKPSTLPPLTEVRERIVAALRARRAQELEQAYLGNLAARLNITINQIELARLQGTLK